MSVEELHAIRTILEITYDDLFRK
ncbi:hypothetical protein [Desulfitobacterium hafniense]|nr:hypothetical protein [Desulfitobacterium hafniense]